MTNPVPFQSPLPLLAGRKCAAGEEFDTRDKLEAFLCAHAQSHYGYHAECLWEKGVSSVGQLAVAEVEDLEQLGVDNVVHADIIIAAARKHTMLAIQKM